eukprot:TRINITY_DN1859_c1_g3_i4.p1 TRINITY_DN1859_c1_g3~~TRINITY_DN1859_c1_g3_i4.p1  ORF type:complete len:517 (-),score=137.73 TRINITY_DN1859_c1_g3_i4:185-1735(-)
MEGPITINAPPWKQSLQKQLKARNEVQTDYFTQLITQYADLLEREQGLTKRNSELEKEVLRMSQITPIGNDTQTVAELEKKLHKMQEDLTASYKRNSDNATHLLQLNAQLKNIEDDNKSKESEIEEWRAKFGEGEDAFRKLEEDIQEKDLTMQVLKGELAALQQELIRSEAKIKSLEQENKGLVDRWLQKMAQEADRLNDANTFIESVMHQNQRAAFDKKVSESALLPHEKVSILDTMGITEVVDVILPKTAKKIIEAHKGDANSIVFNAYGSIFATGGNDTAVKLWDVRSGTLKSNLMGSVQSVMNVAFSNNDEMVLGASNDNGVRVWSIQQGRVKHTLTGHTNKVLSAKFAPDSQRVISGSHDRSIKVWDLMKGYCTRTILCFSSCNSLTLDHDGRVIISGHFDHNLRFWDPRSGEKAEEVNIHSGQITSVFLVPDGNSVLTNSRDNTLKLVDIRRMEEIRSFGHENYRNGVNWNGACTSPDGQFVVAGSLDGTVFIWEAQTGKLATTLRSSQK